MTTKASTWSTINTVPNPMRCTLSANRHISDENRKQLDHNTQIFSYEEEKGLTYECCLAT